MTIRMADMTEARSQLRDMLAAPATPQHYEQGVCACATGGAHLIDNLRVVVAVKSSVGERHRALQTMMQQDRWLDRCFLSLPFPDTASRLSGVHESGGW